MWVDWDSLRAGWRRWTGQDRRTAAAIEDEWLAAHPPPPQRPWPMAKRVPRWWVRRALGGR